MLASLINVPKDQPSWESWFFDNRNQIQAIQQAILTQKAVSLTSYIIYPVNDDNFQDFLAANQQSHDDFNSTLGLQSSDLSTVDPKDEKQLAAWIYLSYQELFSASAALGI